MIFNLISSKEHFELYFEIEIWLTAIYNYTWKCDVFKTSCCTWRVTDGDELTMFNDTPAQKKHQLLMKTANWSNIF